MTDRYSQGDTPHLVRGVQTDYKNIYYSRPEIALVVDVSIQAGYGKLEAGTVLAKNLSASTSRYGRYVPYNPTSWTGAEYHPGRAFLVQAGANATKLLYVTLDDSYKFAVGDDICIGDNVTADENLGAITAIDRTTYPHMAVITATTNIGGTAFTTARLAYCCVEAGSSNGYSVAVAILAKTVDTGTGVNAKGAVAPIILSNAVLYEGMLTNLDSTAKTALGVTSFGQYAVLK